MATQQSDIFRLCPPSPIPNAVDLTSADAVWSGPLASVVINLLSTITPDENIASSWIMDAKALCLDKNTLWPQSTPGSRPSAHRAFLDEVRHQSHLVLPRWSGGIPAAKNYPIDGLMSHLLLYRDNLEYVLDCPVYRAWWSSHSVPFSLKGHALTQLALSEATPQEKYAASLILAARLPVQHRPRVAQCIRVDQALSRGLWRGWIHVLRGMAPDPDPLIQSASEHIRKRLSDHALRLPEWRGLMPWLPEAVKTNVLSTLPENLWFSWRLSQSHWNSPPDADQRAAASWACLEAWGAVPASLRLLDLDAIALQSLPIKNKDPVHVDWKAIKKLLYDNPALIAPVEAAVRAHIQAHHIKSAISAALPGVPEPTPKASSTIRRM